MTRSAAGLPRAPALPPVELHGRRAGRAVGASTGLFGHIADAHEGFLVALGTGQTRFRRLQDELFAAATATPPDPRRRMRLDPTPGGVLAQLAALGRARHVLIDLPNGTPRRGADVSVTPQGERVDVHETGPTPVATVAPSDLAPDVPEVNRTEEACRFGERCRQAMDALRDGRVQTVFGTGFAATAAAVRPPAIGDVVPPTLDEITALTRGGAASGLLRPSAGPLVASVLDSAVELAAMLLLASGHTVDRDGWRWCLDRAQTVRLAVADDADADAPIEIDVDVVAAADSHSWSLRIRATDRRREVLTCSGLALSLVPDWPGAPGDADPDAVALARLPPPLEQGGIEWDHRQLLASTRERPSAAYGPRFAAFDLAGRVSRLPGPPLMLMSRVFATAGEPGSRSVGLAVTSGYVVNGDAWYFSGVEADMPVAVLMEVLLQPCGWLSLFAGFVTTEGRPVRFRNLDGHLRLHERLRQCEASQVVVLRTKLTNVTRIDDTVLLRFSVVATLDGRRLAELDTVFGYFTDAGLSHQAQLSAADRIAPDPAPLDRVDLDLTAEPERFFGTTAALPRGRLRMIDAIAEWSPHAGAAGLGRLRARQWPAANAWYFTAHFFQDPVQPGSLGVEGLRQALHAFALMSGVAGSRSTVAHVVDAEPLRWKYRGQVRPGAREVEYGIEITDRRETDGATTLIARGTLSVDGACIYCVHGLGLRVLRPGVIEPRWRRDDVSVRTMPFLDDHRPNYTIPVMPLMGMVEMIAAELLTRYPHRVLAAVEDLQVLRWMPVETASALRVVLDAPDADRVAGRLEVWRTAVPDTLSRYEPVATGTFVLSDAYPAAPDTPPPLAGAVEVALPYATGAMFHGPSFHLLRTMRHGERGAAAVARVRDALPIGALNPGLLDAALHPIPHDRMHLWFPDADPRDIGYPSRIARLTFHGPTPHDGDATIDVLAGRRLDDTGRFFDYQIQIATGDGVWARLDIVTVSFRRGGLVELAPHLRRAVMTGECYFPAAHLGERTPDGRWRVRSADADAANWLPGSLERLFDLPAGTPDLIAQIAQREALAQITALPPAAFTVADGTATSRRLPFSRFTLDVERQGNEATVHILAEMLDAAGVARGDAGLERLLRERIARVVAPRRHAPSARPFVVVDAGAASWTPLLAALARAASGVDDVETVIGLDHADSTSLLTRAFALDGRWEVRCEWAGEDAHATWEALEPRRAPDEPVPDARLGQPDAEARRVIGALR